MFSVVDIQDAASLSETFDNTCSHKINGENLNLKTRTLNDFILVCLFKMQRSLWHMAPMFPVFHLVHLLDE